MIPYSLKLNYQSFDHFSFDNSPYAANHINCNYETGSCSQQGSGWYLISTAATEPFDGEKMIPFSKATAVKPLYTGYNLTCHYPYG